MFRRGKVSAIDNSHKLIRVVFHDFDDSVSAWLPILSSSIKTKAEFSTNSLNGKISGNAKIEGTATLSGSLTGTLNTEINNYTASLQGAATIKSPNNIGDLNIEIADSKTPVSGNATTSGNIDITINQAKGALSGSSSADGTATITEGNLTENGTIDIDNITGKINGIFNIDIDSFACYSVNDIVACAFFTNDFIDGVILGRIEVDNGYNS